MCWRCKDALLSNMMCTDLVQWVLPKVGKRRSLMLCRRCLMLDRPDVLAWHATPSCKIQAVLSDEQAVALTCQCLEEGAADVIWLQLWTLADHHESRCVLHHLLVNAPECAPGRQVVTTVCQSCSCVLVSPAFRA